jgi:hypothetical protein
MTEPRAGYEEFTFRTANWSWRIEPMDSRVGWWLYITNGLLMYGPNGGPYMAFGTRRRAARKAVRLARRCNRRDERRQRLTARASDSTSPDNASGESPMGQI